MAAPGQRRWGRRVLLGALAVAVVYVGLAVVADVRALLATLRAFDPRAFLLALGITTAGYVVRALRWRLYLHRLGVLEPVGREALGFAAAFAMGMAPGKAGQVVKAYYLQLATRLPYHVSIPATFAERVAELTSVVLLLAVGLALVPGAELRGALVGLLVVTLFLGLVRSERPLRALLPRLRVIPWVARHEQSVLDGHARLRAHMRPAGLAAPAFIGLAAFLLEAVALQVLAGVGLGLDIPFGICVLTIALADLAAAATLIPGGLGVAEGGLVVVLHLNGIALVDAAALTLLFRLCTLWYGVALGGMAAAALHLMHGRQASRQGPTQG